MAATKKTTPKKAAPATTGATKPAFGSPEWKAKYGKKKKAK